jgi:hypothetical protein
MARKGKEKYKSSVGKSNRGHGVRRNPSAKVLEQYLYRNRILPNKKKDVKPEIEE